MKKLAIILGLMLILGEVIAQQPAALKIGDPAPALKYSKWLKGTPINAFRNDRLYVLEFWATWCGPCIAAMPHLSELSKKFKNEATFIGVDVFEKTGDKPYESSLPSVIRFVESSTTRMTYDVIADNNAQDMANNWLKPAGIATIPTTFVVHKGKIVWIGHPMELDKVIEPILAGTFDVAAFKKSYESAGSNDLAKEVTDTFQKINELVATKDFNAAFQLIDEYSLKQPRFAMPLKLERFKILLNNFKEADALDYAKESIKESKNLSGVIAITISNKMGLSKEAYTFAVDNLKQPTPASSQDFDRLANAQSMAGNFKEALEAQQKAVELAKIEVKDPANAGFIFDYTITDYEKKAEQYKSKLNNN